MAQSDDDVSTTGCGREQRCQPQMNGRAQPQPAETAPNGEKPRGQITVFLLDEAGTAASALARVPALRPRVAVLDVRLPDGDGVSLCREIRSRMPEVAC